MKYSREIKTYINRNRKYLKAARWDVLFILIKPHTCKKNFKRIKLNNNNIKDYL